MGRNIADRGLRIANWRTGRMLAPLLVLASALAAHAETEAERAARLQNLTAEQKDELLSKKERFDTMKEEERKRLRELHASIESAPNRSELQQTLSRYYAWLGTLSSIQRDDLRDLPADKRIERIKELLKQQEMQRFQAFVGNLAEADRQAIFKWLGEFVMQHEEEILEEVVNPDERRRIRGTEDLEARQRMLGFHMAIQRQNPKMPSPGREDFNRLMERLTPETVAQIEQAPPLEQPDRVREMVRAAIFSRRSPPPVSGEELRKFYTGLKAEQRENLEGLEPEEFKRRLTWMYNAEKRGWQGGRGFGPPGSGRPGEASRGDGRRGDSKRGGPPGDRRADGPPPEGQESPPPKPPAD